MKPRWISFDYCKHLATLMVFDVFLWYCHRLLQMKLQWVMKSINCDKVMLLSNLTSCDGILYRIITAMCTFQNKLQKNTVNLIWQFLIEDGLYLTNFSWITLTKILNDTYEITLSFKMCQNKMQFFMKKLLCWSGTDLLCLLWILFAQKPHNFGMK